MCTGGGPGCSCGSQTGHCTPGSSSGQHCSSRARSPAGRNALAGGETGLSLRAAPSCFLRFHGAGIRKPTQPRGLCSPWLAEPSALKCLKPLAEKPRVGEVKEADGFLETQPHTRKSEQEVYEWPVRVRNFWAWPNLPCS